MSSKNVSLGWRIHKLLLANGLENPMITAQIELWNDPLFIQKLESLFAEFLTNFGFDLSNNSVKNTPNRVVRFFINKLFYGLDYKNFPNVSIVPNEFNYNTPLVSKGIKVSSTCEHHLTTINGEAIIAYIPKDNVIGFSKLNEIVDFFAKRPQIQERMTKQIFFALKEVLGLNDIAVFIQAKHDCVNFGGEQFNNTQNITIELGGLFLTDLQLNSYFTQLQHHN